LKSSSPIRSDAGAKGLKTNKRAAAAMAAAFLMAALSACARAGDTNFSQRPGFAEYFAANPPAATIPDAADQALLQRYRPRLFMAPGLEPPIRFYEDYIAQGRLIGRDGKPLSTAVSSDILNRHRKNPYVVFEHIPAKTPTRPEMLGRVDRETFDLGGKSRSFTFLTWNATFRTSGIAEAISSWKGLVLGTAGDLIDWHQLDHYTAVTLALDERNRPAAVMFQQHNYRRTYIVGADMEWPADDRIGVDVAARSNEFYPHRPARTVRRAASFLSPDTVDYLVTGRNAPFRIANDITDPAVEVDYALRFLPQTDAFYTFKGFLGEKRLLPGRSGPPGADYNTLPGHKPWHRQLIAFHWRENDEDYVRWFKEPGRGLKNLSDRFARIIDGLD
jgi:hypothetical protein